MQKLKPNSSAQFAVDCRSIVTGCGYTARGATSDEATQRLMAHARNEHDMPPTAEIVARARNAVRSEPH